MKKQAYISKIKSIMNETIVDGTTFYGADTVGIDVKIADTFSQSWRMLANIVPKQWLNIKSLKNYPLVQNTDGTGFIILPTDYYSLSQLKMTGWKIPVHEAIVETEQIARIQQNEYTRGSYIRPVATLSQKHHTITSQEIIVTGNNPILTTNHNATYYIPSLNKLLTFSGYSKWKGEYDFDTDYNQNDIVINSGYVYYCLSDVTSGSDLSNQDYWANFPIEDMVIPESKIYNYGTTYYLSTSMEQILLTSDEKKEVLNYYSLPKGTITHTIEEGIYVYEPDYVSYSDSEELINDRVSEIMLLIHAANIFTVLEKFDTAKAFEERVKLLI